MWKNSWIKPGIGGARKLWQEVCKDCETQQPQSLEVSEEPTPWKLLRRQELETLVADDEDDFTSFINPPPTRIAGTAVSWWSQPARRATYPAVSRMALDCLRPLQ